MCQNLYFYLFFARCTFSSYFCIGVFSHFFQVMFFQVLCFIFAGSLALLLFVFIRSLRSCGIAAAALPPAFIAALPLAFTAALPPTCIHSGIAAKRHCRQHAFTQRHCRQYAAALPPCGIAASMQRHCRHAACTHSGIAASMRSQRQCRQHALVAALPPASTHMQRQCRHLACAAVPLSLISCCFFGSTEFNSFRNIFLFGATTTPANACLEETSCRAQRTCKTQTTARDASVRGQQHWTADAREEEEDWTADEGKRDGSDFSACCNNQCFRSV